jgi:hypothetical protein
MNGTALVPIPAPAPKILCAQQGEIRIEFDGDGNASIIQKNWPDADSVIRISRYNFQIFLDGICDTFGVLSIGGPE